MPKLSKRKRQLKEIYTNRKVGDESHEDPDEEEDEGSDEKQDDHDKTKSSKSASNGNQQKGIKAEEDDRAWVQCNTCDKWRALPKTVDLSTLPDIWYCALNHWDSKHASCDDPEESYVDEADVPLKSFFKVWTKRLKNADRAESRLPPAAVTRGRKRRPEVEWIRCSNPFCGKWRAIAIRGLDSTTLLNRLNLKDKHNPVWYCSMNSWDETTASCAAPQEDIYDAPWNLNFP